MDNTTIEKNQYTTSQAMLERALQCIPLGSQTFSKSITQFPLGVSPYFIARGQGAYVWDVDGNKYIDFVNGLCSVLLGYCDPDVNQAIQMQLQNGATFSLAHELETHVAEKIIQMVPCAQMVRFGKNGSDVTSAAMRLARAFTGRDHIAMCGYHGWQDWSIGTTSRSMGVPKATQALTHTFAYNNIASLKKLFVDYPNQIAAIILEPMNYQYPENNFLQDVQALAKQHGALLVFDEIVTGFRLAKGGAQELFNITPDLVTLGKGMANGMPLSAIAGRQDIMELFTEIFFSTTFGGETLSLAAANASLQKIEVQNVPANLETKGNYLIDAVNKLIAKYQLNNVLSMSGHPAWTFLHFSSTEQYSMWELKTYWQQEILMRGILSFGTHNLSYAHTLDDIECLLNVYDEVFSLLAMVIKNRNLHDKLRCDVLKPLFQVR